MLKKLSLGCLSLSLMGVIGHRQGAGASPPGNLAILKPPQPLELSGVEAVALPRIPPGPEPDTYLRQVPSPVPSLSGRAERTPARVARSES